MFEDIIIKNISKFTDERGWLAEVWRNDETKFLPAMAYVSFTKFGVIRGPHEHAKQSDYFIFAGPGDFELYLWDRRTGRKTKDELLKTVVGASNPCVVVVPPGVVHGYKCISQAGALVINLPDRLYLGKNKSEEADEIRWEKDENSPYKIT